jgi:hypothetical protein
MRERNARVDFSQYLLIAHGLQHAVKLLRMEQILRADVLGSSEPSSRLSVDNGITGS